jgi:hypothetical protein
MTATLFAVDDGIWQGNFDLADILFIVAAILFAAAAVLDFTRHVDHHTDNGTTHVHHARVYTLPLIALGLAFTALGFAVL